jgi:hypothetical protein
MKLEGLEITALDCGRLQSTAVDRSRPRTTVDGSPCQAVQSEGPCRLPVVVRDADWTTRHGPVQSQAKTGPDGPWGTLTVSYYTDPAISPTAYTIHSIVYARALSGV